MHSLRGYAGTVHSTWPYPVAPAVSDGRPRYGDDPVARPRIEADSLLVRASAPLSAQAAFAGLARQPMLGVAAKLVWSASQGFELMAEVPREENLREAEKEAGGALDDALAWLANGDTSGRNGTLPPSSSVIETLNGAECIVRSTASDACFVDANLGGSVYRLLVGEYSDARVRLSFPATTVRVEDERTRHATALFALEANRRLRLARVSVTPLASDRTRLVCDVVVANGASLPRRLPDALEALVVFRDETARALRMLRSHDVADAYLAARGGARTAS